MPRSRPRRLDDVRARPPSHRPIRGDDERVAGGRRRRVELVERHRRDHVLQARVRQPSVVVVGPATEHHTLLGLGNLESRVHQMRLADAGLTADEADWLEHH